MSRLVDTLLFAATLGSGVMAGLYFAFSVALMAALSRIGPPSGMAAMQSINVVILNPLFFAAFFGTAAASLALAVAALMNWSAPGAALLLAGGIAYLASIVITIVWNVPLNNELAGADPAGAEGLRVWSRYLETWTWWNHVRTIACLAAAALLMLAQSARS